MLTVEKTKKDLDGLLVVCKKFNGPYEDECKTMSARYMLQFLANAVGSELKEGTSMFLLKIPYQNRGDWLKCQGIWKIYPFMVNCPADIPDLDEMLTYCSDVLKISDKDFGFNTVESQLCDLNLQFELFHL